MSIRRVITHLPIPKKLGIIIGIFSIIALLLLALSYFGMEILSAIRAYVGGEGLWSKSQKEAVLCLERYSLSRQETDYANYMKALEVPLGDHVARLELEKSRPDEHIAYQGFLQGANHSRDIPGMIHLFRRFRHLSYIDRAIGYWEKGDAGIADLERTGQTLHLQIASGHSTSATLQPLLMDIEHINTTLTPLENGFSFTLGEGARWTQNVLLLVMTLFTGSFLAAAVAVAYLISRHLCEEVDQLRVGAARVAAGDFNVVLDLDSGDEIGDLACTFQQMAAQRRKAEEMKDASYAHVEAANQELEAFSYSVSHDLRAPLRAIDGFSQELLQNCRRLLPAESQSDLERIRAATRHMSQLIDDLLELSRLSRTKMGWADVDISAIVHDVARTLERSEPTRPIEWVIAPELTAQGDPHLIRIALENLIQNAWKFTRRQPHAKIEFGMLRDDGAPRFFIRDNGAGFNMAYADKLFKPFERLHDSKEFPGTGIGLALVQRIIRRHGGTIRVESKENVGTVFTFTFSEQVADARTGAAYAV